VGKGGKEGNQRKEGGILRRFMRRGKKVDVGTNKRKHMGGRKDYTLGREGGEAWSH